MQNILGYYPCRKLLQFLLLEHRQKPWKINTQIAYNRFLPNSKRYLLRWSEENTFGPIQELIKIAISKIKCPEILIVKYSKMDPDVFRIINDPFIREYIELEMLFGENIDEIHQRVNMRIKPRLVSLKAIKQFQYYFWNLNDENGIFQPLQLIELIKSSRELAKNYRHILKYFKDRHGKEKFLLYYGVTEVTKPNIDNVNKIIDLNSIEIIAAFENGNIDLVDVLSKIFLNNSKSLKNLVSLNTDINIPDLSSMMSLKVGNK